MSQFAIELSSTLSLELAQPTKISPKDPANLVGSCRPGHVETVNDAAVLVEIKQLRLNPTLQVDTVSDGAEVSLLARQIVIISYLGVELGDAVLRLGQLNRQAAEL